MRLFVLTENITPQEELRKLSLLEWEAANQLSIEFS